LKDAILGHHGEDRIRIVPVPGIAEFIEKGGGNLGHGSSRFN
jgi:hypothetical protein